MREPALDSAVGKGEGACPELICARHSMRTRSGYAKLERDEGDRDGGVAPDRKVR